MKATKPQQLCSKIGVYGVAERVEVAAHLAKIAIIPQVWNNGFLRVRQAAVFAVFHLNEKPVPLPRRFCNEEVGNSRKHTLGFQTSRFRLAPATAVRYCENHPSRILQAEPHHASPLQIVFALSPHALNLRIILNMP